jgi:hypothetical protein
MKNCPEGFDEELKDFIDDIEDEVGKIIVDLDITCVADLDNIDSALDTAKELAISLY